VLRLRKTSWEKNKHNDFSDRATAGREPQTPVLGSEAVTNYATRTVG